MHRFLKKSLFAVALTAVLTVVARADVYDTVNFSGQLTFITGNLTGIGLSASTTVFGSFVADLAQLPASGSGSQNVSFSSLPIQNSIPCAAGFVMNLGGLNFDPCNLLAANGAIDYNNGQFAGFNVQLNFESGGNWYQFVETGTSFYIETLQNNLPTGNPTGVIVASGTIAFGPSSITDRKSVV